jgi:E3 ubiquitin-protein ligase DOA10
MYWFPKFAFPTTRNLYRCYVTVLVFDAGDQMRAYGGVVPYVLFLFHHTLSIAAWPYAVSAGRCVYFVNYFLVSEVGG